MLHYHSGMLNSSKDGREEMKLIVTRRYYDLEFEKILEEGTEIEVTKKRAELLLRRGFVKKKTETVKSEPLE